MKPTLAAMLACGACTAAMTISPTALGADLLEVFKQAQTGDAVYASARATWSAAQEKLPQARSGV